MKFSKLLGTRGHAIFDLIMIIFFKNLTFWLLQFYEQKC